MFALVCLYSKFKADFFIVDIRNSSCIHIKAICHLLQHYDSVHGITPEVHERANSMNDHTYEVHVCVCRCD